jgi:hypothetical protein
LLECQEAIGLFTTASYLNSKSANSVPKGLLNTIKEHLAELNGAAILQVEDQTVVAILNALVELDHILNEGVLKFLFSESLKLGVEVLDIVEAEQVKQQNRLELVVVVGDSQFFEVLIEELELVNGPIEFLDVTHGQSIEDIVLGKVA